MYASSLYSNNNIRMKSALLLIVPLVLAAFTHLWNPIGFPSIYVDEAHYMRRTLNVLEGLGPQESEEFFHHPYDHPYFGQLFLASILGAVGYPDLINLPESGSSIHSIEMLYMVPRILMGILSIVDTFLLYKIAERRYNRKIACIAAILFAVMPLGWFIRRIWLESIQLPFLLLSILLVVRQAKGTTKNDGNNEKISISMILISGVLLGLAIFTKIPVFAMIPLVGYLVYTNNHRNLKLLGIWFIPIISIVMIWPAYAIYLGSFDDWFADIFWQTSRAGEGDTVSEVILDLFKIDPVLLVLGATGLILSIVKRDLFLFLWTLPYIIFSYLIVHSSYWYFIPLIPAFCLGASRLITILTNMMPNKKDIQRILLFGMISAIGTFGLISTTLLITTNVTSSYFKAAEFVTQNLSGNNGDNGNKILVTGGVGLAVYTLIPMNILDQGHDFRMLHILFSNIPTATPPLTETTDAMIVVDRTLNNTMRALINIPKEYELDSLMQILRVYNSTRTIASFTGNTYTYDTGIYPYFDIQTYPYYSMKFNNQLTPSGPDRIEVRTNFDSVFR
jgi:hypothetical protein